MTNLQAFPLIKRGQASLYSAEWKAVVCVNLRETTNQTNTLQEYTVHINRLCCAADSKNWTDRTVVMILQTVQCGGTE